MTKFSSPAYTPCKSSFSIFGLSRSCTALSITLALLFVAPILPAFAAPAAVAPATSTAFPYTERIEETAFIENDRTKTADGKSYQMTRAVINATPEEIFALIVDYKNAGQLFSNLTKSQVLSRDEQTKTSNVSFSLKGIMGLFSFDYVLSVKEDFPRSIEFHRVSGAFKRNEGYWKLLPLDNGHRTELVYAKYVDGGLGLPPQLVAKQVRESTASVVENIKKIAENPALRIAHH